MSTDTGIDLVAYSPSQEHALTIQVKTNLKPKPGGGSGKATLDWWVPENSPADLIALVDLSSERIWLMRLSEMIEYAQQHSSGRCQLYMYTDPKANPRKRDRLSYAYEFEKFLIENRAHEIFSI